MVQVVAASATQRRATSAPKEPSRYSQRHNRTVVRFRPRLTVYETLSRCDYLDEELDASFYRRRDLMRIRKEVTVALFKARLAADESASGIYTGEVYEDQTALEEKQCLRGLEHMYPQNVDSGHKERVRSVVDAVLAEQWKGADRDDAAVARASRDRSRSSREAATALGLKDETEVLRMRFGRSYMRPLIATSPNVIVEMAANDTVTRTFGISKNLSRNQPHLDLESVFQKRYYSPVA